MQFWIQHQSREPFAAPLANDKLRLWIQVEKGAAKCVSVHYADRYQEKIDLKETMTLAGSDGHWDYFEVTLNVPTPRVKYLFAVTTYEGEVWYGEAGFGEDEKEASVFHIPYICPRDVYEVPAWVDTAVCYQIFPERFFNGNEAYTPKKNRVRWDAEPTQVSMHGGDLPGITKKLPYLRNLGVNLIYLTPIFMARSNHKYDTTDYFSIDPQFGTKEDLRELVAMAHKLGVRVVLDAVFNHAGGAFGPFLDVVKKGVKSPYYNWFFIDGPQVDTKKVNYETFADKIASMPKLNVANQDVERYLLDVAAYWIREFDIDGWRLDVANEIDHVFWRKFRDTVKAVKQDALIIGEIWHNSLPWLRGDEFDGVMNYLFREYTHRLLVKKSISVQTFARKMTALYFAYPLQATRSMFNLLGSHDTERVLTLAEGEVRAVMQAFAVQFSYPGIPMLYYGDEVGMEGGVDPRCRRGMVWQESKQNRNLQRFVGALAKLKQVEPAWADPHVKFIVENRDVLTIQRSRNGRTVNTTLNVGEKAFALPNGTECLVTSDATRTKHVEPGGVIVWLHEQRQ